MHAITPADDRRVQLMALTLVRIGDDWLVVGQAADLHVAALEVQRSSRGQTSGDEVLDDFGPALDDDRAPAGQLVEEAGTDHLIFSVPRLISAISEFAALMPGDLILTAHPPESASAGTRRCCS